METIGDAVEALAKELEWSDEASALGGVDCGYDDDDSRGWLAMGDGLVRVEWLRDPYGDGCDDWVAVHLEVGDEPYDADRYSHLSDAVRDAAHTTAVWQHYRSGEIRDGVADWLDARGETYYLDGPQDARDSWTITWRYLSVQGYYTEDNGTFEWAVSSGENGDCLDGDASDNADAVIDAMERLAADPVEDAFREEIEEAVADDDWAVRTSDDGLTVCMSDPTYAQSRRAYYESVGYGEGRIELEYRLGIGEWRACDERLPEDEADVHAMAREAYEWVKAVAE